MTYLNITKYYNHKSLITLFLILLISACNNSNSVNSNPVETIADDTYSETSDTTDTTDTSEASVTSKVSLSWAAPSQREDNKPISLSEIAGYKIYFGTSQGDYQDNIIIENGSTDNYTFSNFTSGTYYFVLTTFDTAGRESQYSDEIKIIV